MNYEITEEVLQIIVGTVEKLLIEQKEEVGRRHENLSN